MIQSKTSVAINEGILKLENTQLVGKTRRTPTRVTDLRMSLIATVVLDLIIELPRILPAEFTRIRLLMPLMCPHVTWPYLHVPLFCALLIR